MVIHENNARHIYGTNPSEMHGHSFLSLSNILQKDMPPHAQSFDCFSLVFNQLAKFNTPSYGGKRSYTSGAVPDEHAPFYGKKLVVAFFVSCTKIDELQ